MAFMEEFQHLKIKLEDIKSATDNFSENNYIGGGGFGKVYKGEVSHFKGRSMAAFKCLDRQHGQGEAEFSKEIRTLSCYGHKNIISLLGFCKEDGEMILVYEYASHGSLDGHLNNAALTWSTRLRICLDAAKGLEYLHDPKGTHQRVLHCDIKAGNILLDENWTAKVADLGLSKMGPANQEHTFLISSAVGTLGYCDPLYLELGFLTKESDVYSFGVLLFEVLYGRSCFNKIDGGVHILVPTWKRNYVEEKIVGNHNLQDMDLTSLRLFSDIAFRCLQRSREDRPNMAEVVTELQIALDGQEISEGKKQLIDYEEMVKTAVSPLNYRSKAELMTLLSKGVVLNGGTTWLSINAKGEHIEMISIVQCLNDPILSNTRSSYSSEYNSRFGVGSYKINAVTFKTHVRTQFLSPHVTYTVNLVLKYMYENKSKKYIALKYKLHGDNKTSISYLTDEREDGWLMVELYQFKSDRRFVDLEILFNGGDYKYLQIEGIEFRPLNEVEHLVSELEDMQHTSSFSEDETYWEQKLPNDYQDIVKRSKRSLQWTTMKELYSIFCRGFLINNGEEWFSLDKNGKKCLMLSTSVAGIMEDMMNKNQLYIWGSRFGTAFEVSYGSLKFSGKIKSQVLSPQTTYATYLVYNLPEGQSKFEAPVKVVDVKDLASDDWREPDFWYIYLARPQTPVIVGGKVDQNACNPLNRPSLKGIPRLTKEGWMEVQIWQFKIASTEMIPMHLRLSGEIDMDLKGLIVQGIEFRPI